MVRRIWLSEEAFKAIMSKTRPAGLYELDHKLSYWHKKPNGLVLGPRVLK